MSFHAIIATSSPFTHKIVEEYLKSQRFAEKREGDQTWLMKKEVVEHGFSPEVEALTDALVCTAKEMMHVGEELGEKEFRLLQETSWRIALKFYARDGWDSACREVYSHLCYNSVHLLNSLEVPLLEHLGWKLPFQLAEKFFPEVLQRQIDRLDGALREASREATEKRVAFHKDEATEGEAVQAIMLEQWIIYMREFRRKELKGEHGELAFRTLDDVARNGLFQVFEERARRVLKKRPVRVCLVSSAL